MITNNQKKRLENAGYRVSKSGTTVLTKDGASIGGINSNGNIWSGSDAVTKILKGSGDKSALAKSRASKKSKETTSAKSSAPESSSRPKQRQKGRGEPNYGESTDKPTSTPMGGPRRGRKPTPTRDRREDTTLLRSPDRQPKGIAQGVTAKRERAKEVLSERAASEKATKAKQDSAPSFADYMNEKRRENPDAFRTDPSGFRKKVREMYDTTYGFNKGGMVRQGKTDYKGKGMFYKSASPRGYK